MNLGDKVIISFRLDYSILMFKSMQTPFTDFGHLIEGI